MPRRSFKKERDRLRKFGLAYPGAHTKSPWPTHADLAVNNKTFVYMGASEMPFSISCKLPTSNREALALPFTKPTGYGLGKSGWVSATFTADDEIPVELLESWIDESYRAQAPRKLIKQLDDDGGAKPRRAARSGSSRRSRNRR